MQTRHYENSVFACNLPQELDVISEQVAHHGFRLSASSTTRLYSLRVEILYSHSDDIGINPYIDKFLRELAEHSCPEWNPFRGPKAVDMVFPFENPIATPAGMLFYHVAGELRLAGGTTLSELHCKALYGIDQVDLTFHTSTPISDWVDICMAILQSFRVQAIESKKKRESLVKMSPSSVVPKASIAFSRSPQPTTDLVSKFGGQPVWLEVPQWPISPATGAQMQFIGQIAIDRSIFPDASGQMAYIFMTEAEGVATFSADSGENAVIIQPGVAGVPVCTKSHGPTVSELAILDGLPLSGSREVEFTVQLSFDYDGAIIDSNTPGLISQDGSKLGGFP